MPGIEKRNQFQFDWPESQSKINRKLPTASYEMKSITEMSGGNPEAKSVFDMSGREAIHEIISLFLSPSHMQFSFCVAKQFRGAKSISDCHARKREAKSISI